VSLQVWAGAHRWLSYTEKVLIRWPSNSFYIRYLVGFPVKNWNSSLNSIPQVRDVRMGFRGDQISTGHWKQGSAPQQPGPALQPPGPALQPPGPAPQQPGPASSQEVGQSGQNLGPSEHFQKFRIRRKIPQGGFQYVYDNVAVEEPLEIRLGYWIGDTRVEKCLSITMRTPSFDFNLALGFLFAEGLIQDRHQVQEIRYVQKPNVGPESHGEFFRNTVVVDLIPGILPDLKKMDRNFYTTSSCGVCGKTSLDAIDINLPQRKHLAPGFASEAAPGISSEIIHLYPQRLRDSQVNFEKTGGLHAAALLKTDGEVICLFEDVGRHNALDKLIGDSLCRDRLPASSRVVMLSGRASFELLQKSLMAGIQVVACVGAPSSLAVDLARRFDITLIGFLNENRFNLYSGEHRIIS